MDQAADVGARLQVASGGLRDEAPHGAAFDVHEQEQSADAAKAGLPDDLTGHLGPEAMRHSFATLYLDAGGSLSDLQEVMGHADPRTTRRYDRERQAPGRSPGDVVAAYLAAPPHPRR